VRSVVDVVAGIVGMLTSVEVRFVAFHIVAYFSVMRLFALGASVSRF